MPRWGGADRAAKKLPWQRSWLRFILRPASEGAMGSKLMWGLVWGLACFAVLILAVLGVALVLVASSPPKIETPRDVFGFAGRDTGAIDGERPAIMRYPARDGSQLAYRFYDSAGERLLVFAHGSSFTAAAITRLPRRSATAGRPRWCCPICADIICLGGVAATSIMSGNSRTISSTSYASFGAAGSAVLSPWEAILVAAAS